MKPVKTYISLLRGINVSGSKLIKMEHLKQLYLDLGFCDVRTYIQSGNVVFTTDQSEINDIEGQITNEIKKQFGFEVQVLILCLEDLQEILVTNPIQHLIPEALVKDLYVTLLKELPAKSAVETIESMDFSPAKLIVKAKVVFLYVPEGYGNTKLTNKLFETKFKTSATTRNWKTMNTLAALATASGE